GGKAVKLGAPKPKARKPKEPKRIARSPLLPRKTRPKASNAYQRPEWRSLVRQVRKRSGGLCEQCGALVSGDPHHKAYVAGVKGWRRLLVPLDQLVDLCRRCHLAEHR